MLDELLHLMYPRVCAGCHTLLAPGEKDICAHCTVSFDAFPNAEAADCAVKEILRRNHPETCAPRYAWSVYRFHKKDSLQRVVHAMKYQGVRRLGAFFGSRLSEMIAGSGIEENFSCIVPVPLYRLKFVERTYNQSEVIARSLAAALEKDVRTDLVIRRKYTRSQAGLSQKERQSNVSGAFVSYPDIVSGHILLVDDILTTGSTVSAVIQALEEAGAKSVSVAVAALAA